MVKLVLSDIDGTILPYGKPHVSARMLDAIHALQAAGIVFAPCSGRSYPWLAPLFDNDAASTRTAVAANGQGVYLDGVALREPSFTRDETNLLTQTASEVEGAGTLCFSGTTPYLMSGSRDALATAFPKYADTALDAQGAPDVSIDKLNAFLAQPANKVRELASLIAERCEIFDTDIPQPMFINVMRRGWNKATGIDLLCDVMGISLDDVVVFGDGGNDVAMLSHITNSVAVAGATTDAAAAARWHTGACEDDAVADDFLALAKGEWPFKDLCACA